MIFWRSLHPNCSFAYHKQLLITSSCSGDIWLITEGGSFLVGTETCVVIRLIEFSFLFCFTIFWLYIIYPLLLLQLFFSFESFSSSFCERELFDEAEFLIIFVIFGILILRFIFILLFTLLLSFPLFEDVLLWRYADFRMKFLFIYIYLFFFLFLQLHLWKFLD